MSCSRCRSFQREGKVTECGRCSTNRNQNIINELDRRHDVEVQEHLFADSTLKFISSRYAFKRISPEKVQLSKITSLKIPN